MPLYPELDQVFQTDSLYTKMTSDEVKEAVSMSNRSGGSKPRYPWYTYDVGESFFKPMSKDELDADKGRPAPPPTVREMGIQWTSKRIYNRKRKQYGYQCTRIA